MERGQAWACRVGMRGVCQTSAAFFMSDYVPASPSFRRFVVSFRLTEDNSYSLAFQKQVDDYGASRY
jgi:hypothetical protein